MMRTFRILLPIVIVLLTLSACASQQAYVNEEADFSFYKSVGVIPFSNLTSDRTAGDKMTAAFVTELLMGKSLQMPPAGDFVKGMRTVIKDDRPNLIDAVTAEEAKAIGEATKVQGFFVGTVEDFAMVRTGQDEFPLVSVTVRFLDCQTGTVVWSYHVTRKGGPKFPIFSFGETHTLGNMTSNICREVATSFLSKLR
jgi:hypothetical protein